ncbi:thioredoxin reductase [Campylobacter concisus]|uniref:thioredoxin reductase n=1 Tax=Campylobacter concisus TaxID=199 RepID=UPI0021561486|nr:thioredoxin reductase [Campylobacter concisus]
MQNENNSITKKFMLFNLALVVVVAAIIYFKWKGHNTTYSVMALNGREVKIGKITNLIVAKKNDERQLAPEAAAQLVIDSRQILNSSPYRHYEPEYYDTKSDYEPFKKWLDISYLSSSTKISPWTKSEKAYFESLKTRKERYAYLVKRSNLKCAMIHIPDDAIGSMGLEEKDNDPLYKELYENVKNGSAKTYFFEGEWAICAGMFGRPSDFLGGSQEGFKARRFQKLFLAAQLGEIRTLEYLGDRFKYSTYQMGLNKNLKKLKEFEKLSNNPPLDEFGMIPYLDEIVGNYFVMDFNRNGVAAMPDDSFYQQLLKIVEDEKGLKYPRDIDANETTMEEFVKYVNKNIGSYQYKFEEYGFSDLWEYREMEDFIDTTILGSLVMSLTPPEGYPNAPRTTTHQKS